MARFLQLIGWDQKEVGGSRAKFMYILLNYNVSITSEIW